eukprot:3776596-Prymnesium_polylepis.1
MARAHAPKQRPGRGVQDTPRSAPHVSSPHEAPPHVLRRVPQVAAAVGLDAAVCLADSCPPGGCDVSSWDRTPLGSTAPSLREPRGRARLLLRLRHVRKMNVHHYSCWQAARCHHR